MVVHSAGLGHSRGEKKRVSLPPPITTGWERRVRRIVLDEDDEEEEEEEDSGWEAGRGVGVARRRERRRVGGVRGGGDVDEGYEADFIDEEEEEEQKAASWEQRRRRMSALCRLEGGEETSEDRVDVSAAVRLRKEVRRAQRLAGQPSAAVLRRKTSGARRKGANAPLPVLRIDGAAV